jgi:hypothetical protein
VLTVIRDVALRFAYHPATVRLAAVIFALGVAFIHPTGPVNGGS